jgi:molecular chaperone GrpE
MPRRSGHKLHDDGEPIPIKVTRDSSDKHPMGGDGATAVAAETTKLDALKARVSELEKQVSDEKNAHLRALADYQNYRRRSDEQRREAQQFANRELVLGLLPVLDNFERALAAAGKNQNYEALIGGVSLTMRQLQDYLTKHGVEPIEAVGQEFDPNFHEAVMRVEDSEHPENTVVEEVQKGYKMHNRVLRPTMVKVAHSG